MRRPRCLFGLQKVFREAFQHLLLQQKFIHDEREASRTSGGQILIMKGSPYQLSTRLLAAGQLQP
jgi:hypothetical protein